jgi:aminoglycoside 3-N-acetyltransferase
MIVEERDLASGIERLNLTDKPVCLHSSLRSFGHVRGGASTVVNTFLAHGCTLLVPSFTENTHLAVAPPDDRPDRNGLDYTCATAALSNPILFESTSIEIDRTMGAIPHAVVRLPERVRGAHPLDSFAAVGPLATELVRGQTAHNVYAPLEALVAFGGNVLLIGVGLNRMTLLHLAEQRAGRRLFRRWALATRGEVISVETGGCSEGFPALAPMLMGSERRTAVGPSLWRAFQAGEVLRAAATAIANQASITHCSDTTCIRCRDAIAGGPVTWHNA